MNEKYHTVKPGDLLEWDSEKTEHRWLRLILSTAPRPMCLEFYTRPSNGFIEVTIPFYGMNLSTEYWIKHE